MPTVLLRKLKLNVIDYADLMFTFDPITNHGY